MIGSLASGEILILVGMCVGALVLVAYPAGRICGRIGLSPWLGLLALVPIANIALLLYIAFSKWPENPGNERAT